ncbi:MAG: hypothetical protein MSR67_09480 [Oscillospiraceae bacterium]|nr:hypothetical protein [Oscillospiraceae bacterium]
MKSRLKSGLSFGTVGFEGVGGFPEKMVSALLENGVVLRKSCCREARISRKISSIEFAETLENADEK